MKKYILKISLIALNLLWLTSQSFAQLNADFLRHKKLADDCFNKKDYECAVKQYTIANKVKRDDYCSQQIEKCEKGKASEAEKKRLAEQKKRINSNELIPIQKKGGWGFVDKDKKIIIPCIYEGVHSFSEGLAAVKISGKWGFIDKNNKIVIPCIYENAKPFSKGFSLVESPDELFYIDKNGKFMRKYERIIPYRRVSVM